MRTGSGRCSIAAAPGIEHPGPCIRNLLRIRRSGVPMADRHGNAEHHPQRADEHRLRDGAGDAENVLFDDLQ